ncbi:MAG: phosphoribosylamine--glycine ligase [Gammaproteobacteria bacterium]|nr:phosphoribosylamine--glycine ligase [Gammaproteobacteria bacterium]
MKVLVIGSGGREHAIAWKVAQSARITEVLVAPGNAGTATEPRVRNVNVSALDLDGLVQLVRTERIDFTIVGPEAPLAAGVVDRFTREGLRCFGPIQRAAQLESSKSFAKAFLTRHDIPTAAWSAFATAAEAHAYIDAQGAPIVIKADGLAAGKGVVVARSLAEAHHAVDDVFRSVPADGTVRLVIEEFMVGEEASFICVCDGTTALPFASSQDHKTRDDGDKGPNTGGMGAYSPAPVVNAAVHQRTMERIILPTLMGMAKEGAPFSGFLYAGLMIDAEGNPRVVEFNCRFGDPEAQPVLSRLSTDLLEICERAVAGDLASLELGFDPRPAVGVVIAAGGYPDKYRSGDVIDGLDAAAAVGAKVFHAGTALRDGTVVTAGGRVLCVVGLGESVAAAQAKAYAGVDSIHFDQAHWRRDIGYRAIEREGQPLVD